MTKIGFHFITPYRYLVFLIPPSARISIAPKQRTNIKINYCSIKNRFLKLEEVIPKVEELKSIFKKCGEEMEWEAIKENLRMIVIQYRQNFTTLNNDFTKKVKEEEQ
ncbi:unnamed protein product [Rhizophagus irregularis]|uniref:Uncharacterized protein n=1 Tax=Rhizophagus irregularis TaxID=588596 RepID=A0A915YXV9_9GLOM|nr:unnamed protein product [Rhizophagus irregularis]CAB5353561.1 unnamed protein product [Rhizophagus irregularis]